MTTQPTLFDVGRAQLQPRIIAFASGSNEARAIRGFALAGVPVGFSAERIREEGVQELPRFYRQAVAVAGIDPIPALPMKKAGMSHADVLRFVDEVRPARLQVCRVCVAVRDRDLNTTLDPKLSRPKPPRSPPVSRI